jgi:phospholipid/cholesterol/gamma-HCH transport system substrate-binding protein
MKNFSQTARVGLFFVFGLALIWVTFETLSEGRVFRAKGYTLIAGFETLKELKTGDEVRMAGVKIGAVETTRLAGRRAEAVLRIDPEVTVREDSVATIVMAGLLGTNYVGVGLGSEDAPALADGAEIATEVTPDLNSVMASMGNLGQKLEGALGTITSAMSGEDGEPGLFQKLDTLVSDNSENLTATIANVRQVTATLNTTNGTLGLLLNDPALHEELVAAVGELKGTATEARTLLANAQGIIAQVKAGKGAIGALVYDETAGENIKVTVQNIRNVSDKLAQGEGSLGKLLVDDSLYLGVESTLKKANTALDGMNDSGPITAVGIVAQGLF